MDERGFASITAILILLMLAYLIRGTIFTAQNYADMTRNFELENRLQLAAESAFAVECDRYDGQSVGDDFKYTEPRDPLDGVDSVVVTVEKKDDTIKILAVAKKNNYFGNGINAYRSVCGFLRKEDDVYRFKGFLHSTI